MELRWTSSRWRSISSYRRYGSAKSRSASPVAAARPRANGHGVLLGRCGGAALPLRRPAPPAPRRSCWSGWRTTDYWRPSGCQQGPATGDRLKDLARLGRITVYTHRPAALARVRRVLDTDLRDQPGPDDPAECLLISVKQLARHLGD